MVILGAEAVVSHRESFPERWADYGPELGGFLDVMSGVSTRDLLAAQLARQAARGDTAQLAEAENRVPPGARVTLRRGDDGVTATVTLDVVLVGLPPVPVSASAWAAYEPGAGP